MPDRYDDAREWVRGFSQTGADANLEAELQRGRMQKRGFRPDGVPTRARPQRSVRSAGDPLSQQGKPGDSTDGGPLRADARGPAGHDAT